MLLGHKVAATNICCPGLYLFNQCGTDVPIVKQAPARKAMLNKKILERLVQAIDVIDNPNKPG